MKTLDQIEQEISKIRYDLVRAEGEFQRWKNSIPQKKSLPKTKEELVFLIADAILHSPSGGDISFSRWVESYLWNYEDRNY